MFLFLFTQIFHETICWPLFTSTVYFNASFELLNDYIIHCNIIGEGHQNPSSNFLVQCRCFGTVPFQRFKHGVSVINITKLVQGVPRRCKNQTIRKII